MKYYLKMKVWSNFLDVERDRLRELHRRALKRRGRATGVSGGKFDASHPLSTSLTAYLLQLPNAPVCLSVDV